MSAIAGFLLGLGQAARHAAQPIKLITTPLVLGDQGVSADVVLPRAVRLGMSPVRRDTPARGRTCQGAVCDLPGQLGGSGHRRSVARAAMQAGTADLIAVGWDNTCIPIGDAICWSEFAAPLYPAAQPSQTGPARARDQSARLDDGGRECQRAPCGGRVPRDVSGMVTTPLRQLLGVSASADTLRRLHRLGLPDATLTPAHNAGLMRANVVGARRLAELLPAEGRASLRSYPHGCFCTLQLDFPGAPAAHSDGPGNGAMACTGIAPASRRAGSSAVQCGRVRLRRSPRFRATMTAWSTSGAIPALRIAFGDHDPPVLGAVAELIARVLRETRPHRVS